MATVPSSEASREMPTEHSQPAAAPAQLTVNPATNDLTLNPGDTLDETISVTVPKGQKFNNVNLVASVTIVPFVDSVDPPGGYGPITGKEDQTLVFRVRFHGIPCKAESQVFTGTLDVVADGKVVAKKDVKVTVPPCPSAFVYSAKFICGEQPNCGCDCQFSRVGTPPRSISTTTGSRKSRFRSGSFPSYWPARLLDANPRLLPPGLMTRLSFRPRPLRWTTAVGLRSFFLAVSLHHPC